MESKHPTQSSSDEIDLLELLVKVVLVFKRNIVFIIVAFLVGGTLGLLYYKITPNVYRSKMLISSDILTESYSKSITENLNKLIAEGNTQSLAQKLNISEELVSKINSIKITSTLEKASDGPESTKIHLSIEVNSSDNTIWPQLQNSIADYLKNNDYVKIRVEHRKKYIVKVIERINLELTDLEKLKGKIADGSITQTSKENLLVFDPTQVNVKIIDLHKEKINLENSLETVNSVQIVEGFTVFNVPAGPRLSLYMISGALIGLLIAAIFVALKSTITLVKSYEERLTKS